MDPSSRRTTGIAGIVFVVLAVAAVLLVGNDDPGRSDQSLRDFFDDTREGLALAALVVLPVCVAALLWFVAGVRSLLRTGEESAGALPSLAALGGGVFAALFLAGQTLGNSVAATLAFTDRYRFNAGDARLMMVLSIIVTTVALSGGAVFVAATSYAAQRTGLLPSWMVWSGYVVALLSLFSLVLFAWPIALFGLWVLVFSIMLLRVPAAASTGELPGQRAPDAMARHRAGDPGVTA